jgi:hypothetical protein
MRNSTANCNLVSQLNAFIPDAVAILVGIVNIKKATTNKLRKSVLSLKVKPI